MVKRSWGTLAGAVMVVTLAGCLGITPAIGPLGGPGDPGNLCQQLRPGQVFSYGLTSFRNSGDSTVVIDRVGFAGPRGFQVLAAYVVPGTTYFGYGTAFGYPPARPLSPGVDWAARQRADGAKLAPMKVSQQDSLLFVIRATSRHGSAQGVDIWYHAGGQHFHLRTATSLTTVPKAASCPT